MRHCLKPRAYLRYGDDFAIIEQKKTKLEKLRICSREFLSSNLKLTINMSNEIIIKPKWGLKFLGVIIYSCGRKLNRYNLQKIKQKLSLKNISSYAGLIKKHQNLKEINKFDWHILEQINDE